MYGVGSTEDARLALVTRPNDSLRSPESIADVVHLTGDAIGVSGVSLHRLSRPESARFTSLASVLQERDGIRRPR